MNPPFVAADRPWLEHYPPGVPAEIDISATPTLVHLIDEAIARHGKSDQAEFLGRRYTYERVDRAGRHFAAWLAAQGIGPGARVAIMMPNVPQYAAAVFGILRSGATVVNVNPLFTARELRSQLADAQVAAIVVLENFAATLSEAMAELPPLRVLVTAVGDWLGPVKGPVANFVVRRVKKAVRPWKIAGALRFDAALEREPRIPNPVVVCALPLYHIYALVACLFLGLRIGAKSVLVPNPRDLKALVRDLRRSPPHLFPAVNTLYNAILEHPGFARVDFSGLRVANSGGMAVQRSVAERWLARTGCPIIEGWGLTEATAGVTCNRVDAREWSGTVGIPFPGCEIDVRDLLGKPLPPGEPGEVVVRGPQVMAGYWNRPEESRHAFTADGWLRTGDVGVMDAKGELRIVDRMKDMIIVSGFNVYPNEVEEVATLHPGVSEAVAVGVANEKSGEVVKLFVVRRDPALAEADLADFLRARLTGYKRPRQYAFVDSLPKTPVGKVLRRALREAR